MSRRVIAGDSGRILAVHEDDFPHIMSHSKFVWKTSLGQVSQQWKFAEKLSGNKSRRSVNQPLSVSGDVSNKTTRPDEWIPASVLIAKFIEKLSFPEVKSVVSLQTPLKSYKTDMTCISVGQLTLILDRYQSVSHNKFLIQCIFLE